MTQPTIPLAIKILKDDHKKIQGLFRQYEGLQGRDQAFRAGICREIMMLIEIHSQLETNFFYPEAQNLLQNENLQSFLLGSFEEHKTVSEILQSLQGIPTQDPEFQLKMNQLILEVEHHLHKEENELFPILQTQFSDQMNQLGIRLLEEQASLLNLPQYESSKPEEVQNPNGGEQKRAS